MNNYIIITLNNKNIIKYKKIIEDFFNNNINSYDMFHPHSFIINEFENIINNKLYDEYIIMCNLDETYIIGYGILRGYDNGYNIPSLGILIDKNYQSCGYGKILIKKLEEIASNKGSKNIMLKVYKSNIKAIKLYKNLGYYLEELNINEYKGIKQLWQIH